jgi:hypothetical protein
MYKSSTYKLIICFIVGIAYSKARILCFKFIIEYSSLKGFWFLDIGFIFI